LEVVEALLVEGVEHIELELGGNAVRLKARSEREAPDRAGGHALRVLVEVDVRICVRGVWARQDVRGGARVRDEAGVVALRHAGPHSSFPEVVEETDLLLDVLVVVDEEAAALERIEGVRGQEEPSDEGVAVPRHDVSDRRVAAKPSQNWCEVEAEVP